MAVCSPFLAVCSPFLDYLFPLFGCLFSLFGCLFSLSILLVPPFWPLVPPFQTNCSPFSSHMIPLLTVCSPFFVHVIPLFFVFIYHLFGRSLPLFSPGDLTFRSLDPWSNLHRYGTSSVNHTTIHYRFYLNSSVELSSFDRNVWWCSLDFASRFDK